MTDNSGPDWVFNLHDDAQGIPRTLAEGITTRIFPGDQAMLSVVRIEPHSVGTPHSHPQEQWGVMLEGALTRIQGGEEAAVVAGDFWRTPGGVEHSVRTGDEGATVLDVFAPPRDEYRKAGEGFGD
jgi:quercetin dioxygenase-like cupin family protein